MRITRIEIQNYRCLKALDLEVDAYTALVGANGAGKSSVLYALDWFFNGGELSESDVHCVVAAPDAALPEVSVTVTFDDLTLADRERLGEYGRGQFATFKKVWDPKSAKAKVVGNARQGPGFAQIRQMTKAGEYRPAYSRLRGELDTLEDLGDAPARDAVLTALAAWEADPSNRGSLVDTPAADANHMFGINGPNVIRDCLRLVLVPASTNMSDQIGGVSKSSALGELIGSLMAQAGVNARAQWMAENAESIEKLNRLIREGVEGSTESQTKRVNARLKQLVPNAAISFVPEVPDWKPKTEAVVRTEVTVDGSTNDVSRQGHGVQRAVMIAMLQSLVPDIDHARASLEPIAGETEGELEKRLKAEIDQLPTLVICFEEPEIYQHPIRARSFARVLADLAKGGAAQVVLATHSPYFVRPEQFSSLRRFHMSEGVTRVRHATARQIADASNRDVGKVESVVSRQLPTTFSEGFFAERVVIVEGDTDRAVIEALAEKLGCPLDGQGISVVDLSGKENLIVPFHMLEALGSSTYVLVDGDALGAARKHPGDRAARERVHASHRHATEAILAWLPGASSSPGSAAYEFGDDTLVAERFTIWQDDIEEELANWGSFMSSLTALNGRLRVRKDAMTYRMAVQDANVDDLPESLRACVEAIVGVAAPAV